MMRNFRVFFALYGDAKRIYVTATTEAKAVQQARVRCPQLAEIAYKIWAVPI